MFAILSKIMKNTFCYNLDNGDMLREVTIKIKLERIDIQEGIIVEALLDSNAIGLVMSSEFLRKQRFKLKENRKTHICKKCEQFLQQGLLSIQ